MRELYCSEPNLVQLTTSVRGRPTTPVTNPAVKLLVGNKKDALVELQTLTANQVDNGEYEIPIPQQLLENNLFAELRITYELPDHGVIEKNTIYEVARRLMDYEELNASFGPGFEIDYDVFSFVETDVRKIIETYTNQTFNSWYGTRLVEGQGGVINLYENLERLDAVSVGSTLVPSLLTPTAGFVLSESGMSIYNPDRDREVSFFHGKEAKHTYAIEGLWGYTSIPSGVNQAALELARGFMCEDIEYRRRYIANIRNNDMRLEFSDDAYKGSTGNPIADQLLDPYVVFMFGNV